MGDWDTSDPGMSNPWEYGTRNKKMAPFDTEFYLIFNLAVGGVNEYWSDEFIYENQKPWTSQSTQAMKDFWDRRNTWEHTWNGKRKNEIGFTLIFFRRWCCDENWTNPNVAARRWNWGASRKIQLPIRLVVHEGPSDVQVQELEIPNAWFTDLFL